MSSVLVCSAQCTEEICCLAELQQPCILWASSMFVSSIPTNSTWVLLLKLPPTAPLLLVYNEKDRQTVRHTIFIIICIIWCYKKNEFRPLGTSHKSDLWQNVMYRLNGLSCTGCSSSRAGARRYTAMVFCIPASNYFAGKMARKRQRCSVCPTQWHFMTLVYWRVSSITRQPAGGWGNYTVKSLALSDGLIFVHS